MATGRHGQSITELITEWGLNEDAQETLFMLDGPGAQDVLEGFNTKGLSNDFNGKFISFAVSVSKWRRQKGCGKGKSISDFVNHFQLNQDAQDTLFNLTPAVAAHVLSTFNPDSSLPEVNGKFIMYAASVRKRFKFGSSDVPQQSGYIDNSTGWPDKGAGKQGNGIKVELKNQGASTNAAWDKGAGKAQGTWMKGAGTVRAADSGKGAGKNYGTAKGATYSTYSPTNVGAIAGKGKGKSVEQFIASWQLNTDAIDTLFALPPEAAAETMLEWAPEVEDGRDVNGKFIMFACGVGKRYGSRQMHQGRTIADFIKRWNLNEDAQETLFQLTPIAMAEAVNSFTPQTDAADVNGKFICFAVSVGKWHKGIGKGKGGKAATARQRFQPY
eukprot:TRINITY_DN105824_c0_g1_i1.p1 TRINITY_DN105824_c0_g1~~TRINITY_DN105824_c0_g1_i1.p1  ORF type:complete len:392 (-),score=67.23 TRINITY_DN105824_c0_g1_i1:155-1309(-)